MPASRHHISEIEGSEIIVHFLNLSTFLNFIAYFCAIGYGLGTTAQTYTSIDNLATEFDLYVKGNNTVSDSDSAQSETIFWTIFAISLSAAMCKGFFYFLNTAKTNKIAFARTSDTNKPNDIENPTITEDSIRLEHVVSGTEGEGEISTELSEEGYLLAKQEKETQDQSYQAYFQRAIPYFKMSVQLWGSLVGIGLPNGGSMLLQTLRWGVPFPEAVIIASLTMVTNFISIGTIFQFGNRKGVEEIERVAGQKEQLIVNQTIESSEESSVTAKVLLAKIFTYFCAFGYGAGTAIQAFTLNEKLIKDLFSFLHSNDTDISPSTIWFYSFLLLNITASLCKGESYFYNAATTNEFFANDLLDIRESNAEIPATDLVHSKFRDSFAAARQYWGAIGATAAPNGGSIDLQVKNVGLNSWVAGMLGGLTFFTTGVSVKNFFEHGTRPRESVQRQVGLSAVSVSNGVGM